MKVIKLAKALMAAVLFSTAVFSFGQGKFVLVVDDLGNQKASGLAIIESPWVTTVGIMPQRPYSKMLAEYAHKRGKEIIVHAPMSNLIDFPLGPLGLDRKDGQQQITQNVIAAFESVPYAVGLSNHMGSRLTQDAEAMGWVMDVLKKRDMYFFDSRTISTTVAWQVAERYAVPWAIREIFLDHEQTPEFMEKQWQSAWRRVARGEHVTVICHPYPETIEFLASKKLAAEQALTLSALSSVLAFPEFLDTKTIDERARRNMPIGH